MVYPWFTKVTLIFACLSSLALSAPFPGYGLNPSDVSSNGLRHVYLGKRATVPTAEDAAALKIKVTDLTNRQANMIASTARQAQLLSVGVQAMSAQEWTAWVAGYTSKFGSGSIEVSSLASDRFVAPVVAVLAIALLLMILVPLVACFFCCCRSRNKCGGRQPSKKGYSTAAILGVVGFFLCICALNIFAASMTLIFSQDVSFAFKAIGDGVSSLLVDTDTFAENLKGGFSASPQVITSSLNNVINDLTSMNVSKNLELTFDPVVYGARNQLVLLGAKVDDTKATLNTTDGLVTNVQSIVNALPAQLQAIDTKVNALKTVTVDGQTYTIAGFPDTSALANPDLPDMSGIPDIASFSTILNDIPNVAQLGNDAVSTYVNITGGIGSTLNSTIRGSIPDLTNMTSGLTTTLNQTLGGVQSIINSVKGDLTNNYLPMITKFDGYRNDAFMVEMVLILAATSLSMLGVLIRKNKLMACLPPCAVLMGILMWLQFLIFYFVTLPLNMGCASRSSVVAFDYTIANYTLNPDLLLTSCRGGASIFNATMNSGGETASSIVNTMIGSQLLNVDSMISPSTLTNLLNFPSPLDQISSVNLTEINNFDTSSLDFPTTFSFDLQTTSDTLNSTVASLTPATFNANLGNNTAMLEKLDAFNALALSYKPTFPGWNYTYIVNRYVIPAVNFTGEDITENPAATVDNNDLTLKFYNDLSARITFIHGATTEINRVRANVTVILQDLENLSNNFVEPLKKDLTALKSNATRLQSNLNGIVNTTNSISALGSSFTSASSLFVNLTLVDVKLILTTGTSGLINNILMANPVADFGKCSALAESGVFTLEAVCNTTVNSFSGLWFTFMLLGVSLVLTFIFGMKAKKRVEFLERRNSSVKNKNGDKKKGFDAPATGEDGVRKTAELSE